jgi:hypothetical protein
MTPAQPALDAMMEPVAVRYDFDGYGWQYLDSGSGSDWLTRKPDAEPLYSADTIAALRAAPVAMRERAAAICVPAPCADEERESDYKAGQRHAMWRCNAAIRALPLDAPAPVDPVAEAYREGWRFAYRQCEATGSVPNPDHPAIAQEARHD